MEKFMHEILMKVRRNEDRLAASRFSRGITEAGAVTAGASAGLAFLRLSLSNCAVLALSLSFQRWPGGIDHRDFVDITIALV